MNTNELKEFTSSNYAIIEQKGDVMLASGEINELNNLEELSKLQQETKNKVIFITPFCLAGVEKGYETIGDEKIIAMEVEKEINILKELLLELLPDEKIGLGEIEKSVSDEDYMEVVKDIQGEIKDGEVCQCLFSREFFAKIDLDENTFLSIYKKLLLNKGQYMTFLFNTTNKTFVGATPEKHLKIKDREVTMNPIAGTMPKGDYKSFFRRLLKFSLDDKEINELFMVLDEELKMMLKISYTGKIEGPFLQDVGAVIHTAYELIGQLREDCKLLDAFKETLYAPTLVGGPLESAFKLIKKYESNSRGYYGGAFGILDEGFLDTAITIRTAFIDKIDSILTVRAGAGIVRDSKPDLEMKETIAKSNGFLNTLTNPKANENYLDKLSKFKLKFVKTISEIRNRKLSKFLLNYHIEKNFEVPEIKSKEFKLISNGDNFVQVLGFMIRLMGGNVEIIENKDFDSDNYDNDEIFLIGPGYGNINDEKDPRMTKLLKITKDLIDKNSKILGVCLGHQAICKTMGADILKQPETTQGLQIDGKGFYNSFAPYFEGEKELTYKSDNISSTQHHPESVMTIDGFNELKKMILEIIKKNI